MNKVPDGTAEIRRELCKRVHCTVGHNFFDPCESCKGNWPRLSNVGCDDEERTAPVGTLGDKVSAVLTPIAHLLGADCVDPATRKLRPTSRCAKSVRDLNAGKPVMTVIKERLTSA